MHCRASSAPEVAKAAPELLRTLIFCSPPEWACKQHPPTSAMHPDKRRMGTLAAVMARAPDATPDSAIGQIFTEHVDVSQRLLVLDALCAAAHELAGTPLMAPLTAAGTTLCTTVVLLRGGLRGPLIRTLRHFWKCDS